MIRRASNARRIAGTVRKSVMMGMMTATLPGLLRSSQPSVQTSTQTSPGLIAFVNVAVIPMDTDRVLWHETVLIHDGVITAMGPTGHLQVPAGSTQIDGKGAYLLPGLANMHAHLFLGEHLVNTPVSFIRSFPFYTRGNDSAGAAAKLFLWLANGVTTIRNMDYIAPKFWNNQDTRGGDVPGVEWGRQVLQLRALAAAGTIWSPRIYTAGQWGPSQYLGFHQTDPALPRLDSVSAYITAYQAAGYDLIKIHSEDNLHIVDSVLVVAKRLGLPVAGHVPVGSVEHILPFYRSIEHPLTDYAWRHGGSDTAIVKPDTAGIGVLLRAMRDAGVWHCPTQGHYDRWHGAGPQLLRVEHDAGVKLLLGTDEFPWLGGITQELQAMVDGGLTPYQALLTGTRNVAEYFGTLATSGTIAVGKRADLVLLTGNPLVDIRYTAQPAGVMVNGRWLSRTALDQGVASLRLPTYTVESGVQLQAPIKRYWQNVADALEETALAPLGDIYDPAFFPQLGLDTLQQVHQAQVDALADSLATSDEFQRSTQRLLTLLARQLGEDRQQLSTDRQAAFDQQALRWLQQRRAEGYTVNIPR